MPLTIHSSESASRNVRRNRKSIWPDGRKATETRLQGLARVEAAPTFPIGRSDRIMTIGSCFAREIEKYLAKLGFALPTLDVSIPAHERVSKTENDILNKYTVHSMENEIRWGFEPQSIAPENFFLRAGEDTWHDGQLVHNLVPASLDRVVARRAMVSKMMSRLPECRVTVITLGLVEAWYDTQNSLYLNGIPPQYALQTEPERFQLRVLDYEEILAALERIHALIARHGHPDAKILLTVSPVPFKATMTGQDAMTANTYGKSVQRAAAEAFSMRHDNVNYFPSYEIVTLSERSMAYEQDNIHVTPTTVSHIMSTVLSAYISGFETPAAPVRKAAGGTESGLPTTRKLPADTPQSLAAQVHKLMKARDDPAVITLIPSMLFRFPDFFSTGVRKEFLLNLGTAFLRVGQPVEGVFWLRRALDLDQSDASVIYKLGLGVSRLKQHEEAITLFTEATTRAPSIPDHHWRLGIELCRMDRVAEGRAALEKALALQSDHTGAIEQLKKLGAH